MLLRSLDTLIGVALILGGLSLVVTLAVQAVASALALRGTNLRWGLQTLFTELEGSTGAPSARELANAVLMHPLVSDSILSTKISRGAPEETGFFAGRWALAKAIRADELVALLYHFSNEDDGRGRPAWPELRKALATGRQALDEVKAWFDGTMDRVSQRFATQVRIYTVILSFFLAFLVHVDMIRIVATVSEDPAIRAALVGTAATMAETDLKADQAARELEALRSVAQAHPKVAIDVPDVLPTGQEARSWLQTTLSAAGLEPAAADKVLGEFDRELARRNAQALRAQVDAMVSSDMWEGLDLWPGGGGHVWKDWVPSNRKAATHFLGILFGGALLSLGAPFWFNLLKNLMSLRPVLASKEQREREQPGD